MTLLILVKLLRALSVLAAISLLTFLVGHASGDPVLLLVRGDATLAQKSALRADLGLDRSLPDQYARYVGRALQGDFGISYRQRVPVSQLIAARLPGSLALGGLAFALAAFAGAALGLAAALRPGRLADRAVQVFATLAQVFPGFWIGLVLVLLFAVHWPLLPVSGSGGARYFILPMVTLAIPGIGRFALLVRGSLLDVLSADYIRTARAKGLRERDVLLGHAARNACLPLLTQAALELGDMVGSAFIVETVFAWPGIGRLTVNAVLQRDFLVAQACVLIIAAGFVMLNLLVDLLYAWADPRVRGHA